MSQRLSIVGNWVAKARSPGWWACAVALCVLCIELASIATTGAWDPWETHYGEVARQMLVRRDPLDLWWQAGNGGPQGEEETTFWSKPALPFWLMAASMKLFGVGTSADPAEMVRAWAPAFAIRLPSLLAGSATAAFIGLLAWRMVSPRAGVLCGLVLATMPQWAIVTRQALTDMFFVGPVVLAVGAWLLAWSLPDRPLRRRGRGVWQVPFDPAYAGFLVALTLTAVLPLAMLHAHVVDPRMAQQLARFAPRPGTPSLLTLRTIHQHLFLYWGLLAVILVASTRWRQRSQVWLAFVYLGAGLSLMGKGLIGPGLVGAIVLADLIVISGFHRLRHSQLLLGSLMFVLVSFPWHHAMVLYRGEPFVNELIVVNNLARFGTGEQVQAVGNFTYYLETFGLAALPWSAIMPVALIAAVRAFVGHAKTHADGEATPTPASESAEARQDTAEVTTSRLLQFALVWWIVTSWAIGFSVTKYYHYLLPVLPPAALLLGTYLDAKLANARVFGLRERVLATLTGVSVLALVMRDLWREPAWLIHLSTYLYTGMWREGAPSITPLFVLLLPFVVGLLLLGTSRANKLRWGVGALAFSALLTTAFVIDVHLPAANGNWSQRDPLRIYFERRQPHDRLVSWWMYFRGETFFSKADIWVMREPSRERLGQLIEQVAREGGDVWFMTTPSHARRLPSHLPTGHPARRLETVYETDHYALLRLDTKGDGDAR